MHMTSKMLSNLMNWPHWLSKNSGECFTINSFRKIKRSLYFFTTSETRIPTRSWMSFDSVKILYTYFLSVINSLSRNLFTSFNIFCTYVLPKSIIIKCRGYKFTYKTFTYVFHTILFVAIVMIFPNFPKLKRIKLLCSCTATKWNIVKRNGKCLTCDYCNQLNLS